MMGKLAQINNLVQEAQTIVHEFEQELSERIESYNQSLEEFRLLQENIESTTIPHIQESLKGIQNLPEVALEPLIEAEGEELEEIPPVEHFDVQMPTSGTFAAKFWGFLVGLILFLGFGIVGAVMKKMTIAPNMIDMKFFEQAYGFYSDLITGSSHSAPYVGIVLTAAVSIVVGYLVYLLVLNKAAGKNLQKAKEIYEEAKAYIESKRPMLEMVKTFKEFLDKAIYNTKGSKLFGEEFASRTKRIRFFEGDDFEQFVDLSKKDVTTAKELEGTLEAIARIRLVQRDGFIVEEIVSFFDQVGDEIEKIRQRVYSV